VKQWMRMVLPGSVAAAICLILGAGAGCGRRDVAPPEPADAAQQVMLIPETVREKLLDGAMTVLGRLEDYDEAAAFGQVFDRLNQWSHGNPAADAVAVGDWQVDPLLAGLPERLRTEAVAAGLEASVFDAATDVAALRDQRWLADISTTARGDAIDDLDVATRLFDWTVRSLAIDTDPPMVPSETTPGSRWFLPGEILLSGRASAAQRSWIFLQLLRHAGLDGVMLATGPSDSPRPWVPAVLSGGEAYLFEPTYGLPVPGPGGKGVATVRQAAGDPTVLAGLSLPDRSYPVQATDMERLSILVAADPWLLSRRMHLLDKRMAGSRAVSLALAASAVAERARAALPESAAETATAGLWEFPWETAARRREPAVQAAIAKELAVMALAMEQPVARDGLRRTRVMRPLYAARVREFRGDFNGPDGAKAAYLAARPTTAAINAAVAPLPPQQADRVKRLYEQMKEDATYWLGILTLAEGDTEAAIDYLDRLTLQAAPDSPWTDSARINLAAAYSELGRTNEAAALLEADTSPQRFGSRIQAARLEAATPESP
jgi:hypothetical protein